MTGFFHIVVEQREALQSFYIEGKVFYPFRLCLIVVWKLSFCFPYLTFF